MSKDITAKELKAVVKEAIREILEEECIILKKEQNQSVRELGFSSRVLKALYQYDIDTVGKLLKLTVCDFATWRNIGRKSIAEIENKLKENNLRLRG